MSNRGVLFDLDGTLVDLPVDIEAVRESVAALFAPRGYTQRFAPILACIAEASEQVTSSESERLDMYRRAMALLDAAELVAARSAQPIAGVAAVVNTLVAAAVPVGIVTNNSRGCVAPALAAIGLSEIAWASVVSRDDAVAKPNPGGVSAAARKVLPKGGTVWFVGDGDRDIEAAHNANDLLGDIELVSVGLNRGNNEVRLRAASPAHVIDELSLLLGLVGLD